MAEWSRCGSAVTTTSIPKTIHRVWIGAPMPAEFAGYADDWQRLNPGHEVRLWTEADIDQLGLVNRELYDRAPELCPERYVPRFRSNLVRYEILHRHGGVYVDCDMVPLAPLPEVDASAWACWEQDRIWIGNSVLASAPGHPFFAALIDGAAASVAARPGERSPITTGPQYLTRTFKADVWPDVKVLPERMFYPQSWRNLDKPPDLDGAVAHHLWAAKRGQVSVIIPFRPDGGHRDRSLQWVVDRLTAEHPDWQIVIEEDHGTGPFNRAALLRTGVARSFGDIIVAHDADVWCPSLPVAVAQVRQGAKWALPHTKVHRLTETETDTVWAGDEPSVDMACSEAPYPGVKTGGAVVIDRATFHNIGPDPRFSGWGGEDDAWGHALTVLAGTPPRAKTPLFHLWHPPQPRINRRVGNLENDALQRAYRAAKTVGQMRALIGGDTTPPPTERVRYRHRRTGRIRVIRTGTPTERRLDNLPHWERA